MKTQQKNIDMLKIHRLVSNKSKPKPRLFFKLQCVIEDCSMESWKSCLKPTNPTDDSGHHL